MLGFFIVFWVILLMISFYLVFVIGIIIYVLIGIKLEEVDMIFIYGNLY